MRYFIRTFGCQMNKADSERIAGVYQLKGYQPAKSIKEADVVIVNTCSVRQSAEDRVLGLVNNLSKLSRKPKIILTGCMLRYTLWRLKKMLPGVDKFIRLDKLIPKGLSSKSSIRGSKFHAWIPILSGCDNFCTYCVVPYARGPEVSRPMDEIICEVKELVKRGYKEITLLGQNVNSYAKNLKLKIKSSKLQLKVQNLKKQYKNNFAILLVLLHSIKELKKIKFLTSNPQDLSDDIIQAMKLPKIDRYLHLAVQSGDDQILRKMNRKYTAKQYLALIKKIRKEIPDIEIGTDIIVGFPGETKKQFQNTVDLCKKIGFKVAYIAKYSPRPGTAAYKLKDNVPFKEKKRRWRVLHKLINKKINKK
jgi:tRNA-2-methylthio-N6-dimethylallyladenosine synthase